YAPFGGPQRWTYGNGLTHQIHTDLDGRTQRVELFNSANQTIWTQRYGYDPYNNITRIDKGATAQQFDYDVLHRLTAEKRNGQHTQFTYDPVGNRIEGSENNTTTNLAYTA